MRRFEHLRAFQFKPGHKPVRRRARRNPATDPNFGQGKPDREKMLAQKRRDDVKHFERTHARKKNPGAGVCIRAQRRHGSPVMNWDGEKFTNVTRGICYKTAARASEVMQQLVIKYPILKKYSLWTAPPYPRSNPDSRQAGLDRAADKLRDFSGHEPKKVLKAHHSDAKTGLEVGTLDGVLYTAIRDNKHTAYIHKFRKSSRPLLAVTSDGKQLIIVGGRYEFTEAGIEDR